MPHMSLVTLGVDDVASATAFYEKLGFVLSKSQSNADVSFFRAGGVVLALYGREALREDAQAQESWIGQGGIALAQNMESEAAVDAFMKLAEAAGAHILKPAAKTFWGGYGGYFADVEGHVWEIAHNPLFPLDKDGLIELPD